MVVIAHTAIKSVCDFALSDSTIAVRGVFILFWLEISILSKPFAQSLTESLYFSITHKFFKLQNEAVLIDSFHCRYIEFVL